VINVDKKIEKLIEEGNKKRQFFVWVANDDNNKGIIRIYKHNGSWNTEIVEGVLKEDIYYCEDLRVEDILKDLKKRFGNGNVEIIDIEEYCGTIDIDMIDLFIDCIV